MQEEAFEMVDEAANERERVVTSAHRKRMDAKRQRKAGRTANKRPAVIPWELLDQLDGERKKFENQRNELRRIQQEIRNIFFSFFF